jgi:hypothetical protein
MKREAPVSASSKLYGAAQYDGVHGNGAILSIKKTVSRRLSRAAFLQDDVRDVGFV